MPVHVLEAFANEDLCGHCVSQHCLALDERGDFQGPALLACLRRLERCNGPLAVLPGSGLEGSPGLLARLQTRFVLLGNPAGTVAACKDPARFFPLLQRLGIPHPKVRLRPGAGPWSGLRKCVGGAGGTHIVRWRTAQPFIFGAQYLQDWAPGLGMGAAFVANGHAARLLGLCEHYVGDTALDPFPDAVGPFVWRGAISGMAVERAGLKACVEGWLQRLVPALRLHGLGGLDFLHGPAETLLLEINPRPPASLELYVGEKQMVGWHIDACAGRLPFPAMVGSTGYRAMHHLFAPRPGRVPGAVRWPPWVRNRPRPGLRYATGDPLCTVFSSADCRAHAESLLRARLCRACQYLGIELRDMQIRPG